MSFFGQTSRNVAKPSCEERHNVLVSCLLGIVLEELQRIPQAAEAYRRAIEHQRVAYAQAAGVERFRTFLSKHCYNYGRILRRLGFADHAAQVALERKKLWPDDPQRLLTIAEELALASQISGDHRGPGMTAERVRRAPSRRCGKLSRPGSKCLRIWAGMRLARR
jgi:hypothetical protein